jgi:5'(3')-deoxyribonucleotidase
MKMTIWFDMDGTIADLYGVENWLHMVRANDPTPYLVARPLVNLSALARMLNKLQKQGYEIGVISWLSKTGTPAYDAAVTAAKYAWLSKHLPSVDFDEIHVVPYGTPKQVFAHSDNDILFDDEAENRENWTGLALDVTDIIGALKAL